MIESRGHAASDATVFRATRNRSIERSSAGSKKSPEVPRGERRRAERLTPPSREKGDCRIVGFRLEFGSYFAKFSYLLLKIDG